MLSLFGRFKKRRSPKGFVEFCFRDYDWDRITEILKAHELLDTPLCLKNEEGASWEVTFTKDAIIYNKKAGRKIVKVAANKNAITEETTSIQL